MSSSHDVEDAIRNLLDSSNPQTTISVQTMMEDWFDPKPEVMKHVIIVQLIACIMVATFLLATASSTLNANDMMVAVFSFFIFIAAAVGVYGRL
jgi:hypothetical protein